MRPRHHMEGFVSQTKQIVLRFLREGSSITNGLRMQRTTATRASGPEVGMVDLHCVDIEAATASMRVSKNNLSEENQGTEGNRGTEANRGTEKNRAKENQGNSHTQGMKAAGHDEAAGGGQQVHNQRCSWWNRLFGVSGQEDAGQEHTDPLVARLLEVVKKISPSATTMMLAMIFGGLAMSQIKKSIVTVLGVTSMFVSASTGAILYSGSVLFRWSRRVHIILYVATIGFYYGAMGLGFLALAMHYYKSASLTAGLESKPLNLTALRQG